MRFSVFYKAIIFSIIPAIFLAGICFAQSEAAPDEENCLICHRFPNMGRIDENGEKRIFYINDQLFGNSVHGKLRCKDCHVDLDKIPHEDVKKVDCSTQCHIKEPSSNRDFSHKNMVDIYNSSVHGRGVEGQKRFPEDLPTCTYCHSNRVYNPYEGVWGKSAELSMETLARCQGCHVDKGWTKKMYSHFTHRMRRQRDQNEIIKLCTSCHEDEKKMERHGLEAVSTFKDTFHWALVKYEVKNAPDCTSCHVPVGYTTHELQPRTNPISPIHPDNRVKTCSNQGGIQDCHPGATIRFAEGRVHAYGTKVQLMAHEERNNGKEPLKESIMLVRARKEISPEEVFHYKVLAWIKLIYQFLIAAVIGSMTIHQLLDYRRARKK
jgi:hypothetical protein